MSNERSGLLLSLSLGQFAQFRDEDNDGVIECFCASCNRLLAASRDRYVLDIACQTHVCAEAPQARIKLIA
jgi:hypothetical protein